MIAKIGNLDRVTFQRICPQARIVGEAPAEADWVEPLRMIYDHELVFFEGGEVEVEINHEQFLCGDKMFIIVPPGVWHSSRVAKGSRAHRYWVHFDWCAGSMESAPVMTLYPERPRRNLIHRAPSWLPKRVLVGHYARSGHVRALHAKLLSSWQHGDSKVRLLCQGILFELLVELLFDAGESREISVHEARIVIHIRDELERLSKHTLRDCPLLTDHLAGFGVTYEHACRLFRRRFGTTPLEYITAIRIERSKRLLLETVMPIHEVAMRVGYESHTYFTRKFQAAVGLSPSNYRLRNVNI